MTCFIVKTLRDETEFSGADISFFKDTLLKNNFIAHIQVGEAKRIKIR